MHPAFRPLSFLISVVLAGCAVSVSGRATLVATSEPVEARPAPTLTAVASGFTPYERPGGGRKGELVVNGGFEEPFLAPGSWTVQSEVPGWVTSQGPGVEIQNGVAGTPREGLQHIELDSHAPSAIQQALEVQEGAAYALRFAYSPRPGVADNAVEVRWGGAQVSRMQRSGEGLPDTLWQEVEVCVRARSSRVVLEFRDVSAPDSVGGYIDSVSVVPATRCEEAAR